MVGASPSKLKQLSTTAAADGLQLGSGLRRIACLAALLVIFVASGVRAAGTYTVTVYNGATISSNDYKALSALCSPLGLMNGNTSGGKTEFLYQSKDHFFTCNTSTYKCSVPATTLPIEKSFPITAYKTILQQSGTYTWLANYDAIKLVLAVAVDGQNFPDTNFRNWVKAQSYGSDGILTTSEIAAVTKIDVSNKSISSLKGIEYFTALTELKCFFNQLTELDVSKNTALGYLYCYDNQLKSLDVSKNTALIWLYCNANQLTSLDVSNNTALTTLECSGNQLKSLDVSKNTALKWLFCEGNQLTSLDVSNNTALYDLYCSDNQLTTLDVSGCTALEELYCRNNQLTSLDVSNNTALKELRCGRNQLTTLDVSSCTGLKLLVCDENQLTTLDVSGCTALTELNCYANQLTSLDVSKNTALTCLYCICNQIRGTAMTKLVNSLPETEDGTLWAYYIDDSPAGNMMTPGQVKIAREKNWNVVMWDDDYEVFIPYEGETPDGIEISEANFPDDNFRAYVSSEDIDRNRDGYLSDDEIVATTEINVSYLNISDLKGIEFFNGLKELNCSYNQLTSLDVSHNMALTRLYCYCNRIRGTDMTKLVNSLPDRKSASEEGTLWVYYIDDSPAGNMMTPGQVEIAKEKNWNVVMWDDDYEDFIPYEGETPDGIEISEANFPDDNFREYVGSKTIDKDEDGYLSDDEIEAVTEIDVMYMDIEDLTGIGYFTALKTLYAGRNKLTELDLSKNTALDYLGCSDNQLTELDLGENTALTTLYCGGNQLTELDLRNNTKLESVNICNSQIYGEAMDRLIESLPTRTVGLGFGRFYAVDTNSETEGNIITKLQKHNLSAKRWSTLNARGNGYYPETIPGDFNGDGLVNTQDIDCLRDYILGIKSGMYIFTEAELTDDLKADIVDLTQLIEILLKR